MHCKTPQVGFEPTTNRLTVDRSATELLRIAHNLNKYSEKKNFWQVLLQKKIVSTDRLWLKDILEIKQSINKLNF